MNKRQQKKPAFTLMETVVMLFVLSVGVLAIVSLVRRSFYFQDLKKNMIIASYLAQEGIEIMKNIRDTNLALGSPYDAWDGVSSAGIGEKSYKVDYYSLSATDCVFIEDAVLQEYDGFLLHSDVGEDTIFKRLITVRAGTVASTSVEAWISWIDRGQAYDYRLETTLYDLSH